MSEVLNDSVSTQPVASEALAAARAVLVAEALAAPPSEDEVVRALRAAYRAADQPVPEYYA